MATAPIFMLRTVASDGTLEQFLPDFAQIDMSPVYCDAGTVQFSYPESGVNFGILKEDIEIAVTMNGVEILELRSLIETIEGDDATDAEGGALWKFTARTAVGKLDDAIVYPLNWSSAVGGVLKKPKQQTYTGKYMGYILNDLLTKAKNRGSLAKYTWDFTATHDSEGNAWTYQTDLTLDIGKSYLDVFKEMAQNGWIEFRVEGRLIKVFDAEKMGVDRSTGPSPLHFRKGRDVKESPRKINTKGLKSYTLVSGGDNTVFQEVHDTSSSGTYGRRESFYSAGSMKYNSIWGTTSTLALAGNQYLRGVSDPQMEVTHGLHFESEDQPRPITNFNVGDWALTDVGKGVERFRILQWVMSVASDRSVTGSITMNWLFNTQLSQVSSALNKLENGTVTAGTGPKNDGVAPAQVTGVIPSSANYFVNSIPRATLDIAWDPVTTNEDGSEIFDLDYYQVSWKYTSDTNWRATIRVEAEDGQTAIQITNLDPGASAQVRVRAADYWNNFGDWSTTAPVALAGDTIAPPKPASPVVVSSVGTLRVTWSGLAADGSSMPPDLAGVEVHVSNADFTPSTATKKDVLPPSVLATTLTGLTYGTEYWVKLVAFDTTGNKSAASDTTTTSHAVLKQVVSTEIGSGQVGLSQTTFSDVGNLIDDGSFEIADIRTARTQVINAASMHLAFDNTTASNGTFSLRSDSWASPSTESLLLQGSLPVKPGERVFGAADYRQTADVPSGSLVTLAIKWVDKNGAYIDNTGAVNNVFYTLSDSSFAAKDNVWHSRVTNISQVAPTNSVKAEIWLIAQNRSAGTIWLDAVEIRKQIDTALIQQAAITTALIADLAVNDAKMANVSIGKLIAGSLTADMTVSARIKTADTGARAELNSGGFGLWNSAGTQTVMFAGSDGSVRIQGNLISGTSGRRIDINPYGTGLPEIRFYPNSGSNYGFLNAVSSGSDASVGLNSSQFTANGVTSGYRVYLTPSVASFELMNASTQSQYGPGVYLYGNYMHLNVDIGGTTGGILDLYNNSARVGRDSGGAASALINFDSAGKIFFTGEMNYYSDSQDALLMGHYDGTDGPISGFNWTWGFTLASTAYAVVTPYDNNTSNYTTNIDSRSTTGFGIHFGNGGTVGAGYGFHFWAWRE